MEVRKDTESENGGRSGQKKKNVMREIAGEIFPRN